MKPLKVKNMNKVKQNDYPNLHPSLTKPPFFSCIVGSRCSGKSNLVKNLILRKDMYGDVFAPEDIFYISSTVFVDDSCEDLPTEINKFDTFDMTMISDILEQCKDIKNHKGKKELPDILFIIDDLGAESKVCGRGGYLEQMSFTCRHFNVSCFVLVQKYSSVCPGIRNNSDLQIFFRPMNLKEIDHILDEHSDKSRKKAFTAMLNYAWAEPYDFFTISKKKPVKKGRYMRNFEEPLSLTDFKDGKVLDVMGA